ncbi:MAG TPA: oligosaccharide flippase family protein [Candidatus Fimivivens sp.]|nr:oligosaccharide flippase family protein [Candidatus Fimivivens sp.]
MTFAKNSAILFSGNLLVNVMNYVYHLVIGRQVSVSVYGEAESLISLITIVSVPAATLTMVAAKYAAACKADGNTAGSHEILSYLNRKVLKYGLPIFIMTVLLTPMIGSYLNVSNRFALVLIWISMYVSFFGAVNGGLLSGWQKFAESSIASVLSSVVKLVSGVALVAAGLALGGIVGSLLFSSVAGYALTSWYLRSTVARKSAVHDERFRKAVDFASLRRYVMPAFFGNLAITVLGNADMILAKHNLTEFAAGQYGALTVVSKVIYFGTGVIAGVLFSMSAEKNHKGESSRHILGIGLATVAAASLVATLLYFLFPTTILGILFGNKYADAAPYLGWFAVVVSLYSLSNVIFQYLLSLHRTRVAYAFLAVTVVSIAAFELYGKSISSMLAINIAAQAAAIIVGALFLVGNRLRRTV